MEIGGNSSWRVREIDDLLNNKDVLRGQGNTGVSPFLIRFATSEKGLENVSSVFLVTEHLP